MYMTKSVQKQRTMENAALVDFEILEKDMPTLDNLTTPAALQAFEQLYRKCVNRDTTKDGTMEGVKMDIQSKCDGWICAPANEYALCALTDPTKLPTRAYSPFFEQLVILQKVKDWLST